MEKGLDKETEFRSTNLPRWISYGELAPKVSEEQKSKNKVSPEGDSEFSIRKLLSP